MSKELEDNNIDRLFRTSIDNMETEPSDRFWNKAYDGILKNESKAYERKILMWRGVSAVLAVSLVALIGYNVYTNNKVTNIEKEVATIENRQLLAANNQSQAVNVVSSSVNGNSAVTNQQSPKAVDVQNSTNTNLSRGNSNVGQSNNIIVASNNPQASITKGIVKARIQASSPEQQTPSAENAGNFVNQAQEQSSAPVVVANTNADRQTVSNQNGDKKAGNNLIYLDQRTPAEDITIPPQDKVDDEITMDVQDNTTVNPISGKSGSDAWVAKKKGKILHSISLSAFAGPSMYSARIKNSNPNDGISAVDIKNREQQQDAYTIGVNAGYDLSKRFTFQTGVAYRSYRFFINPSKVYAPSGDLNSTYPILTSSGAVDMPYISGYSPTGYDTVATAKGNAVRSYVSVPVRMQYNFVSDPKFKLYMVGGGSANFLVSNHVTVHCQNQWGSEDDYIDIIDGTKKMNFSYMLGLGAEFQVGKAIKVFAEPSYCGAITPTSKVTPITAYSNYFDFAAGVSYHF